MIAEQYRNVVHHLRALKQLGEVSSLLHWDQEVLLPKRGAAGRGDQLAIMAKLRHEQATDPRFVDELRSLTAGGALSGDEAVVVREAWRDIRRAMKVPAPLVEEIARSEAQTHTQWIHARKENRFSVVKNELQNLIALKREYAAAISADEPTHSGHLYDALLDLYEPGATTETVARLFSEIRPVLIALTSKITERNLTIKNPAAAPFPQEAQRAFLQELLPQLGFSFDEGRLDESVHPFCSDTGRFDLRITTRYTEDDILPGLMAAIHETGHALYELGLPIEHYGTPLAEACSMGIHESQSLLWEKQLGRSREFWSYLFPVMQRHFPAALAGVDLDSTLRYVNRVQPSLIRVDADEVTYGLHVILRFELERRLIENTLAVDDLSEAWNESYREYLGITPPDEVSGVLQDTHWYIGAFGYFPSYLLGAVYSAQLYRAFYDRAFYDRAFYGRASQDRATNGTTPDAPSQFAQGDFSPLLTWLRSTIHHHGRRYSPLDLISQATGHPVTAAPFTDYLTTKYEALFLTPS